MIIKIICVFVLLSFALSERVTVEKQLNKTFPDHVVMELSLPMWTVCLEHCSRIPACKSINFIKSKKLCQINDEAPDGKTTFLQHSTGDIFVAASSVSEEKTQVPLKVYSHNRMLRKGILAHSYHDLINKCKDKFMTADHPVKLVLDTDGVEIDEDFFIVLPGNTVLMLLKGEEMWMPQNSAPQDNSSTAKTTAVTASGSTTGNKQSNLLEVVSLVRRKRNEKTTGREHFMSHNKKTPQRKAFVKISLGWLYHDGFRYIQIRSANGGGTRVVDMKWESSYTDILERAKELFFPNNTSPKGHWDSFHNKLGDFKQNVIVSAEFTLQKYVEKNCLTLKPRIYLMSKEILEDKDFELPDLLETGMSDVDIQIMTDSSSDEQNDVTIPDVPSDVITSDVNFSSRQEAPSSSASPNQNIATSAYIQTYYSSDVNTTARQDSMSTSSSGHSQITASQDIQNNNSIIDPDLTLPYNPDHSYNTDMMTSPVVVNTPSIPSCSVCSDRFCDAFLTCGHIICYVCAVELEERGSLCPVCRVTFSKISKLFY